MITIINIFCLYIYYIVSKIFNIEWKYSIDRLEVPCMILRSSEK